MFTEYRPVDPNIVSDIRNRFAALKLVIQDIEQVLNEDELWMSIDDLPLIETIIDRVSDVSTLLHMFNNTSDPLSPTPLEIRDRVYQLTSLIRSLQRTMSTQMQPDGIEDLYQQLQVHLEKFYLGIVDLNDRICEFE
jgi:hypothetical protein